MNMTPQEIIGATVMVLVMVSTKRLTRSWSKPAQRLCLLAILIFAVGDGWFLYTRCQYPWCWKTATERYPVQYIPLAAGRDPLSSSLHTEIYHYCKQHAGSQPDMIKVPVPFR